ncbi:hypothetical protein GMDG_08063 [Pseudogymnoascus destructans 20631-21]|uniref:Uncharacterized protein n=1 Tax=Pseudogymnoascus destructans (strain ATCC MYA-4855 / 20631-21) TaxID=658429 RepID=L8G030_PSED2|nr:hypothetical protein GMDG_08063 [Pseudogymnoascus destructans 20631-21]
MGRCQSWCQLSETSGAQHITISETIRHLADFSDHEEGAASSLLRHRKSLHNLFGTVGKRSSMKGRTPDQTVQSNVLRKRSGGENTLQIPDNPGVQSIKDADRVRPPQTYAAGSHAATGRGKVTFKDEIVEPVARPDSGVNVDAIYAPRRDYQGSTLAPRAPDQKQTEAAFLQPPKAPIELVCLPKKPSSGMDSGGYAAPFPPTCFDRRPATQHMVSRSDSCLTGPYPGTISQSLRSLKENLDFGGPDYNILLASPGMPSKIDINPSFTSRAQALEQRYNNLLVQSRLKKTSNTEHVPQSILESINQNAARMSKNLNISEGRSGQSRHSCHSNETAPLGSLPQDSSINTGFLGHECGTFTQDDTVDKTNSSLDKKVVLDTMPKKGNTTPSRENVICDERPDKFPGSTLRETLSASPLLVPKRTKTLPPRKKRRAMRSTTRNISIGPFHIDFPKTEFGEARHETYQSKSDAIGSLFQNPVVYSNYILFDRGSSTFYPQPKGYVFKSLDDKSKPKLECIWLPMQFGNFKAMGLSQELSLNRCAGNHHGGNHQLPDIRECEGAAPATLTAQPEETQDITSKPSNHSLLDLYLGTPKGTPEGTPEGKQQRMEAGMWKQPEVTLAMTLPIRLAKPLGEPASPPKLGIWGDIDDGVITEPMAEEYSIGKTKTWADLGVEFIDKYAPNKNADAQKRAVDAARNFLRAQGKLTSDYDSFTRPQRKTWSRDRDGSEDISFLHIEDLARYETLRAEYRRHMTMFSESSSGSNSTDALAEVNYTPKTREVSRASSRDSGYAGIDATLAELHLSSWEMCTTSEAFAISSQCSSSTAVEEIAAPKATSKITFSPSHSPAPSVGEEHVQSPVLQSIRAMGDGTPPRIVRTCSFGKFEFELENPFNTQIGNGDITGNIDTEGFKTPRRGPLQGERSNFIRQGRMIQHQPASQAEAAYHGPTDEPPLQKRNRDEEDEKENEERNWRDMMLYG